jgi:hypothetical protein
VQNLSTAKQLLYTTTKIVTYLGDDPTGSGTGFFYSIEIEGGSVTLLITNKHVLQGSDKAIIRMHCEKDGVASIEGIALNFSFPDILLHPEPEVDLCALGLGDTIGLLSSAGHNVNFYSARRADIPTPDEWLTLDAIEEVTMIGCPRGIADDVNNFPIVRRGVTSSDPSKPYNGKPEFMVDMACFPGSSGSPIYLFNPIGYYDPAQQANVFGTRVKLLGVLYAGPQFTANGTIVFATPPQFQVNTMMHLGYAIRSSQILVLEELVLAMVASPTQSN